MVAQHHHLHDVTVMYAGIYREYVAAAEEALFPVTVSPDRLPVKYVIVRVLPLNRIIQIEDAIKLNSEQCKCRIY